MHTPLDPHLHTAECNEIIAALQRCHSENNKLKQFFGICNDLDTAMRRCTRSERLARAGQNRLAAKERQAAVLQRLSENKKNDKSWREVLDEKK